MDISVYFLIDIGVGALLMILAVPMMLGKVKPNRWYGFRTPKTMANDDAWYRANRYAGKAMVLCGLAMMVMGGASIFLYKYTSLLSSLSPLAVLGLWNGIMLIPILIMVAASLLYHSKM